MAGIGPAKASNRRVHKHYLPLPKQTRSVLIYWSFLLEVDVSTLPIGHRPVPRLHEAEDLSHALNFAEMPLAEGVTPNGKESTVTNARPTPIVMA